MSFYYFFKWLLIILLIIPLFLATFHFVATKYEEKFIKPSGRLVDIEGRRLHLFELGKEHSGPTVILIHGGGATHLDWQKVQPEVAKFARVVSYDQAGFGWSDQSTEDLTSKNSAKDLLKLLKNSNLSGPYILVGHSIGGFIVREFANLAPEKIASAILVDSTYEHTSEHTPAEKQQFKQMLQAFSLFSVISRLGIFRLNFLLKKIGLLPSFIKTASPQIISTHKMFFGWTKTWRSLLNFYQNILPSLEEIKKLPNLLINKPLIILAAGKWDHAMVAAAGKFMNYQKELAKLSNQSELIVAENAGHDIPNEQPEIIIESIKKLVLNYKKK